MKTFEKISKQDLAHELQWHFDQDKIIQGSYKEGTGDEFKGCMMGCAVNSIMRVTGDIVTENSHRDQAKYIFGDESCQWFVRLYEKIFESLDINDSKKWVIDCFNAIPEGIDHTKINSLEVPIKIWILESTKKTHKNKEVHKVTDMVIAALRSGNKEDLEIARKAAAYAYAAAYAAADAAADAADADAAYAAAADAAYAAAYAAAAAAAAYDDDAADARKGFYKDLSKFVISQLERLSND